uniref:Uncharacterized protein n=1 Tax=Hyaloperonospora arabidopsidis (strain Emoy2) TaxID=559515 RepID=M4BIH1_HYAAE
MGHCRRDPRPRSNGTQCVSVRGQIRVVNETNAAQSSFPVKSGRADTVKATSP